MPKFPVLQYVENSYNNYVAILFQVYHYYKLTRCVKLQVIREENEKNKIKYNELESLVNTKAKLRDTTNLESKVKVIKCVGMYVAM